MKLLILGATGKTGQQILIQALDEGHDVTVLVRPVCLLFPGQIWLHFYCLN